MIRRDLVSTIAVHLTACMLLPSVTARAQDRSAVAASDPDVAATCAVDVLLARMTPDERLHYVQGWFPPLSADRPADMIPSAGYVPGVPRLGIPTLRESDASLGVANQVEQRKGDVATALPSGLALAATFDPELAYRAGTMIGSEARAKTFNVLLAGGVNLTRDPWGGRDFEYLGEDPLLAGIMAGASIRGIQSNHIVSTVKHFALNSQETLRTALDARIDEAALRESDLLAFEIAIERGQPGSVMCAYNKVNGDWACENDFLLDRVLRHDWGYKGWVMSDWGAVHSTARAVNAGLDQESGRELDRAPYLGAPLARALRDGGVSAGRLGAMNRHILWGVTSTGLIDHPVTTAGTPIDYAAHARVAQEVAEKGIVLLKNDGRLLPLARTIGRIVVIGGHADVGVLSGGGSSQVRSVGGAPIEIALKDGAAASFARITWHASSPLAAIRASAPGSAVMYVDGSDAAAAAAAAKAADLAIVFATQWRTEAQEVESLALPDRQDALIEAVARANPRMVVVLETGGPVLMPWLPKVAAVLQAWYPGQRGGEAIADILFGTVSPSGRLPITFPRTQAQAPRPTIPGLSALSGVAGTDLGKRPDELAVTVPYVEGAAVGYRSYLRDGVQPLFPFGFGLSYTSFRYSALRIEGGRSLRVSFDVSNSGRMAGADTPQIYVTAGHRGGPTTRLAGFQRVELAPGQTRHMSVPIDPRIIADYDVVRSGWHVSAGTYPVKVGGFAGDARLAGSAILEETRLPP